MRSKKQCDNEDYTDAKEILLPFPHPLNFLLKPTAQITHEKPLLPLCQSMRVRLASGVQHDSDLTYHKSSWVRGMPGLVQQLPVL